MPESYTCSCPKCSPKEPKTRKWTNALLAGWCQTLQNKIEVLEATTNELCLIRESAAVRIVELGKKLDQLEEDLYRATTEDAFSEEEEPEEQEEEGYLSDETTIHSPTSRNAN